MEAEVQSLKESDTASIDMKFEVYGPGIYKDIVKITDANYLLKSDNLPKELMIGDNKITVKRDDINNINVPSFYLIIDYKNQEEKIGFSSQGTGVLTLETKRWDEEPTQEEANKGILGTRFIEYIALLEIDYDSDSNDWNYIKVGTLLLEEKMLPNTTT